MAQLNIKLAKSLIGCKDDQIATAHSLGLRKVGDCTTQPDNAQMVPSFLRPSSPSFAMRPRAGIATVRS